MPRAFAAGAVAPRPFLKWAGGKGQLLEQFAPLFPDAELWRPDAGRYLEPFLGGGAVFFRLRPENALLSDLNRPLVECYRAVRDEVEAVIRRLSRHRYDRDYYYAVRDLDPAALALAARAARWIYLNHACFNGLWRVNSRGRFNVPFGRHVAPTLCDAAGLRTASAALEGADIAIRDFRALPNLASAGDFVYLDPPYHPLSATARFTAYTAESFTPDDQADLAGVARALAARGCLVMLSNSDTPLIRDLYDGAPFNVTRVIARRSINRDATRRAGVPELVVRNYPT